MNLRSHSRRRRAQRFMFVDTETTGLPDRRGLPYGVDAPYTDLARYDGCRIVQIAVLITDGDLSVIAEENYVVRAEGFVVPPSAYHRITQNISQRDGVPIGTVADVLLRHLRGGAGGGGVSHVLAHNAAFDLPVIKAEMLRAGRRDVIAALDACTTVCTMHLTKQAVGILRNGTVKPPRLQELYEFATGKAMENAHDALWDIRQTREAVAALVGRGVIAICGVTASTSS